MALTANQQGAIRRALCEPPIAQNAINTIVERALGYDTSLEARLIEFITQFEENETGTDLISVDGVTIDPVKAKNSAAKAIGESIGWVGSHSDVVVGRGSPTPNYIFQNVDFWDDYNG